MQTTSFQKPMLLLMKKSPALLEEKAADLTRAFKVPWILQNSTKILIFEGVEEPLIQ